MKQLVFYHDPNHDLSAGIRTNALSSRVPFMELDLTSGHRQHNVTRGGPLVLIDVDGQVYLEFATTASGQAIATAFAAAPDSVQPSSTPIPADVTRTAEILAMDTSNLAPMNRAILDGIKILLRRGVPN